MATKIGRSFDEIDAKIKQFNTSLKTATTTVKQLDKDLKLDPGNVDAVRQKYTQLSQALQINTDRINALRERQEMLRQAYENGEITSRTYNSQLARTSQQLTKAEQETESLTEALKKQNRELEQAKLEQFTKGLDKAKQGAEKLSVAALGLVAALGAVMKASIDQADALNDTANKYQTSAENLQIWRNRLTMLAGDTEAYTSSLAKVGSMLTSIAAGRGARYIEFLERLGITTEDLNGKSNAQIFDAIYEGLRATTDATERATIAQALLGDTGLEIAVVAGTAKEAIDGYDQALIDTGVISTEQAMVADQLANKWASVQFQFQASSAELMVALVPAFETLCTVLQETLVPIVSNVANWLSSLTTEGQQHLMTLLLVLIVLPKIIAIAKTIVTVMKAIQVATHAQAAATATLNAVSSPWLGIIMAISVALIGLISLIGVFNSTAAGAAESANELLQSMEDVQSQATGMAGELVAETTSAVEGTQHRTLDINLDVEATGDTPISESNAELIASGVFRRIDAEALNAELGAVIK